MLHQLQPVNKLELTVTRCWLTSSDW